MNETNSTPIRRLAFTSAIIVVIHVAIALYFIVTPIHGTSYLENLYRTKILIGPFFTDTRIQAGSILYVRYKAHDESWTEWSNLVQQDMDSFRHSPWRYDRFKRADYLRGFVRSTYYELQPHKLEFDSARHADGFRDFNKYLIDEFIQRDKIDSIEFDYKLRYYARDQKTAVETTIWNLRYDPNEIDQ